MNITEYLKQHGTASKQVVFNGEAFTAANIVQMRNRLLRDL